MVTVVRSAMVARMQSITGTLPMFKDDNEIGESDYIEAIDQAVKRFSNSVPREIVEDEVGDSGKYYPLSNLKSWDDDWSRIVSIDWDSETRVTDDALPNFLKVDDGEWQFYRDATTRYLVFPSRQPSSSVTYRVTYTAFHILTDPTSTIPTQYEEAVLYLAISKLAVIIQFHLEKAMESAAGAAYPSFRNRGSGMAAIAKTYEEMYIREMGGTDIAPATAFRNTDLRALSGRGYLFHAGSRR